MWPSPPRRWQAGCAGFAGNWARVPLRVCPCDSPIEIGFFQGHIERTLTLIPAVKQGLLYSRRIFLLIKKRTGMDASSAGLMCTLIDPLHPDGLIRLDLAALPYRYQAASRTGFRKYSS